VQPIRDVEQINARLAEISPLVLPPGLRLYYAGVDELQEQDVNPRSMPQKMFNQLVENVQGVGALESAPLCVEMDGRIQIISGHHRLRAARAAGVQRVLVLLYEELPPARIKSKQLAHNTISGQDDPELVARLWQEIEDIQARFEAFVDPRQFDAVPPPVKFKQVDVDLAAMCKTVLIAFLPVQKMDFEAVIEAILPQGEIDAVYLADRETYDAWRAALQRVRQEMDVVAIPTAIAEMARLALAALDARAAGDEAE
jgi:hypothetical protein